METGVWTQHGWEREPQERLMAKKRKTDSVAPPPAPAPREPNEAGVQSKPTPGLYLVATPIGNLRDITLRALDLLRGADVIACEDTRVTRKLLQAYGITTPMLSYHEHNAQAMRPKLMKRLESGEVVALVSDAGTPLISDPGFKLVEAAVVLGVAITSLPGASSVITALTLSALPTDRFFFAGFLPAKSAARRKALAGFKEVPGTLVFFESAPRLQAMLADASTTLGAERPASVARELTKKFEELRRGPLCDLAAHYRSAGAPKGEVVVLIGQGADQEASLTPEELDESLKSALAQHSLRDAVDAVVALSGLPRKQVYARALAVSEQEGS